MSQATTRPPWNHHRQAEDHDVPVSPDDIISQGMMSAEDWAAASGAALALFEFGQKEVRLRGVWAPPQAKGLSRPSPPSLPIPSHRRKISCKSKNHNKLTDMLLSLLLLLHRLYCLT
jgi:hypothetical protein